MWQNRNDHKQEIPSVSASPLVWVPGLFVLLWDNGKRGNMVIFTQLNLSSSNTCFLTFQFFLMLRYSFILECNINKWLLDFFKERSLLVKIKWHIYVCSFHWLLFQIPQSLEITEWLIFKFSYSFGNLIF